MSDDPEVDRLVERVVVLLKSAVAEAGLNPGIDWQSVRIPFEVASGSTAAGVGYYETASDVPAGVRLDIESSVELAHQLAKTLTSSTGIEVARIRVAVNSDWTTSIQHFGPRKDPNDVNLHLGIWPDEPGYDGPVHQRLEIVRSDSWEYQSVAGHLGEPADSLARIRDCLGVMAPEFAVMLNPPSPVAAIDRFEDQFGVVLPKSVRESWLVHDGQSDHRGVFRYRWLSVADAAEHVSWLDDRPDGREGLIPLLRIDGHLGYVEAVSSAIEDGPVWLWEMRGNRDLRLADSLGEYLAWFASACESDQIVVDSGLLNRRDEI